MTLVYDVDGIKLYHGDCLDVMPRLNIEAGMVLTDPPFTQEVHSNSKRVYANGIVPYIDFEPFNEKDIENTFRCIANIAKGWVVSFLAFEHTQKLKDTPPQGLSFVRAGMWFKPNTAPHVNQDRPSQGWESIAMLHATRKGKYLWNGNERKRTHSVFVYNICGQGLHPSQKPLQLMIELIELFSTPYDLIFDPFAGSGTTLLAAKITGRRAVGIEMNAKHCDTTIQRLRGDKVKTITENGTALQVVQPNMFTTI